jgi:hypothetical protein
MFDTSEYKACLKRAFIEGNADYITVDGWCSMFIRQCTDWALEQGWVYFDQKTSDLISESQYTAMCYRLTDKGRQELVNA